MKKILIVTGSRAEYGLLKPLIKELIKKELDLGLLVTGTHLEKKFGYSISEIEKDGFPIWDRIKINAKGLGPNSICKSLSLAIRKVSNFFEKISPDLIIVLGDRYELLAICQVATVYKIPIAHIHGGEKTEGLIDESIRHSITKMSHLHFASTDAYRKRIIQMGEKPSSVFNVGALGVENIKKIKRYTKLELENFYKIKFCKIIFLITYHPATLSYKSPQKSINQILKVLSNFDNAFFIFSYPNADTFGNKIIKPIKIFKQKNKKNCFIEKNIGLERYISLMNICDVVVGNSSSGIIEAPTLGIPTVNIGIRQKGRIKSTSIIDCNEDEISIEKSIKKALSKSFKITAKKCLNPYYKINTSKIIADKIFQINPKSLLLKSFYDLK